MAQSYNSKLANDMAEKDNVDDGLTDDEFATLFPEKLTTVSAELQKLIEKRNKDPKFNIKLNPKDKIKSIESSNKFNSRNSSVIIPFSEGRQTPVSESESTFDPEDFESMQPEFSHMFTPSEEGGSELLTGGGESEEKVHPKDVVESSSSDLDTTECPECRGFSKHNKPEYAVYANSHCDGCNKRCGGEDQDISSHCRGCKGKNNCEGRQRAYWHADPDAVCPTCKNEGEIEKKPETRSEEVPMSDAIVNKEPEEDEESFKRVHEDENSFGSDEEEKPLVNNSKMFKSIDGGEPVEIPRPVPEKSYVDEKTGLDSPVETAAAAQKETSEEPEERSRGTVHSRSCKCNGTGIVSDLTEISKINNSDEFRSGMKKINNSSLNENDKRRAKQDFIVDQYKCKEQI